MGLCTRLGNRPVHQSQMPLRSKPKCCKCHNLFLTHHDVPMLPLHPTMISAFSSFPFHPGALALTATAAIHIHIKLHPHHATATFDKAPSKPATNAHCQHLPSLLPDTTMQCHIHATEVSSPFTSLPLPMPCLAMPRLAPHSATPCHAMSCLNRTSPFISLDDSLLLFCNSLVCCLCSILSCFISIVLQ